ncbi:MAG: ankyrin repeat domain-containing protein [Gammaproteobacteria bacterium]|nr:ankyrin repeat domain-containing protein [Gammaproteobacteria bacterium]
MADTTGLEQAFAEVLGAGESDRLASLVKSTEWRNVPGGEANRVLQLVGAYGVSGRTSRYRGVAEAILASGVAANLASCALLGLNEQGLALLAAKPEVAKEADADGATALHHAAERGNLELARAICDGGAELDALDRFGETPLAKALHAGPWKPAPAMDVVDLLRARGATVDFCTLAALGDVVTLAERLGTGGQDVDERDTHGRTALFVACRNNQLSAVRLLLGRGADADMADTDGQTPLATACLHMLSQECDVEIVRLLLAHGAKPTLESAVVLEDLEGIRAFVAEDAGLLQGHGHESALGYAIHVWRPASLRCLLELGAVPDEAEWGHVARIAKDPALVDELRGLTRGPPDRRGRSR